MAPSPFPFGLIAQAVSEEMFEIVNDDGQQTGARPWVYYKLIYEPSGELKTAIG